MSLEDFLGTDTPREELTITLKVLREFKENESSEEWAGYGFDTWYMLERFEGYLEQLVEGVES